MKRAPQIKVVIVDDHPLIRNGIVALLESQPDLKVVGETGSGEEAVELHRRLRPDIVLMDLRLPGMSGVEAIQAIRKESPDARIIVLTTYDTDEDIYRAVESGAKSYLLKDGSDGSLLTTIRAVHAGEFTLPERVATLLEKRRQSAEISAREMEVLNLLVKGRSNKEICNELNVTEDTVKFHFRTIFTKLKVRDRTEAVVSAIRHGIVHLD